MLHYTILLFAISAVFGLTILISWLKKKNASRAVVYSHGAVAAIALAILIVHAVQNPNNFPLLSIILFLIAALGGFYMFVLDLKKKESPLPLAFLHAILSVAGLVTLIFFVIV